MIVTIRNAEPREEATHPTEDNRLDDVHVGHNAQVCS
jgi:hypothetical protein